MNRAIQFIRMCWLHKSISSAAWVDAYTQEDKRMSKYRAYEAAKRQWIAANPAATPDQYEAAMRLLAKRYGI